MAAPKKVDYDRIEPDWRAGIKSAPEMAAEYTKWTGVSVSHPAIVKHFKKLGVPRDLKAKINAKADALIRESIVTGKVSAAATMRDAEIIVDNAVVQAEIRVSQRVDISRSRKLVLSLLGELEEQTDNRAMFEELGEIMRSDDARGSDKRNDLYMKVIGSAGRIDSMKKLSETLKTLIGLEREAYGITNESGNGESNGELSLKLKFVSPNED